jgi:2-amino-4-hydroxy-6-hydroxymethyldihydropteridine diphosphokinase
LTSAVLSIGSNLGDRVAHLRQAVAGFGDAVLVVSDVYESPPWGDLDQPAYLNAALLVAGDVAAQAWLERAAALERDAGRVRDPSRRFGPRPLDIDVIAAWAADGTPIVSDDPELTLPHPRAHLRAFVLRPWLDIAPYAELPGRGRVADLILRPPVVNDLAGLVRQEVDLSNDHDEPVVQGD